MAKIFISYADEDKKISTKLESKLKQNGAKTWIDYANIYGGDNFVEATSNAIEWCDTLILLWSESAAISYYVKKEWTAAFTKEKKIIICILDETELPTILYSSHYIDFTNFLSGYLELRKTLYI